MNIFYNDVSKSYYFDTLNVIFKENVNQDEFKSLIKKEIANILSMYKEEDKTI